MGDMDVNIYSLNDSVEDCRREYRDFRDS